MNTCPNQPLISVVIPMYNVEQYIGRCIESVINQSYNNIEIIIVNDGSTDNSRINAQQYLNVDNRCRLLDKKNGGLSSARNYGLENSSGKYILFLDSDDYIKEDTLRILVGIMEEDKSDFGCFGYSFFDDNNIKKPIVSSKRMLIKENKQIIKKIGLGEDIKTTAWSKIYNREFLINNSLYFKNGIINEDYLFTFQCGLKARRVSIINQDFYMAYMRSGSISRNIRSENITSILEIEEELTREIKKYKKSEYLPYLRFSFFRCIIYTLLQISLKNYTYQDYKKFYSLISCNKDYKKIPILTFIKVKRYWAPFVYQLSKTPYIFWQVSKLLKLTNFFLP